MERTAPLDPIRKHDSLRSELCPNDGVLGNYDEGVHPRIGNEKQAFRKTELGIGQACGDLVGVWPDGSLHQAPGRAYLYRAFA